MICDLSWMDCDTYELYREVVQNGGALVVQDPSA